MTRWIAALIALAAAATLAFAPSVQNLETIRLEHDPDQRAVCVGQLLAFEQLPITAVNVLTTLDYTDRYYGGPCAAVDHYMAESWY